MLKLSEKHTLFFRFSVVKSSNPRFGDFVVLHSPFSLFAPLFFSSFIPAGSRAGVVLGQENSNLICASFKTPGPAQQTGPSGVLLLLGVWDVRRYLVDKFGPKMLMFCGLPVSTCSVRERCDGGLQETLANWFSFHDRRSKFGIAGPEQTISTERTNRKGHGKRGVRCASKLVQ